MRISDWSSDVRSSELADVDAVIALGCALPTVLRGFDRCGPVRIGQSVVVQGAGPVGLAAVLVASLMGAREVIAVDVHANRLDVAKSLGATATVSLKDSAEDRRRQIYRSEEHTSELQSLMSTSYAVFCLK